MKSIFAIAVKDIRLLLRDRMAAFFVLGFPLLMGLFFGLVMGPSGGGEKAKMKVAVVDLDQSKYSQLFVQSLQKNENLTIESAEQEEARSSVQNGKRVAMLVIPAGFGKSAGLFWEDQPTLQLGVDPSRTAEGAMVEGFVMEAIGSLIGKRLTNPSEMLGSTNQVMEEIRNSAEISDSRRSLLLDLFGQLDTVIQSIDKVQEDNTQDAATASQVGFKLASIEKVDVTRAVDPNSIEGQVQKLRSRWDISFPQAMLWGILGCVAGFAISVAQEREAGTLMRLCVAPIHRGQLLSGKALACFLSTIGVVTLMTIVGYMLGLRPLSFPKLAVATVSVAFCFVGIMMILSTLGKSVQSVSGIGWATNMIMAMIGGCMIPIMFMPAFIANLSVVSPVRWAILSLEGAIWRDYSWSQLLASTSVLWGIGAVAIAVSIWKNRDLQAQG
ncbi:MAG: ABC transporter permease [Pirellulales bacterium]